jgi:hypothetical protein
MDKEPLAGNSAAAALVPHKTAPEKPRDSPDLKTDLAALDPSLVFDDDFYPKALARLAEKSLPPAFLSWLYEQCLLKKPASLRGMFYKLFFAPDMAESFKASYSPPREALVCICPVCGATHDSLDAKCPHCGVGPDDDIEFHKKLYALPPLRREEYKHRLDEIIIRDLGRADFKKTSALLDTLNKEFSLT